MERSTFILLFVAGFVSCVQCDIFRTVRSPSGPIKGIGVPYQGNTVFQYRNIPYAEPPLGNLRLRNPVPHRTWTDVLDATKFGPSCIQDIARVKNIIPKLPNKTFSEDCLQLNVYTPNITSSQNRKSVMIWVHGGAYMLGQASLYDPTLLVTEGDVIVVTVNYRLGALGFLSTGDNAIRGNYGLWDQQLAFEWVKNNIASFGGDPDTMTIFGQSAGAFSVGLHAMIPMNRGLFTRMISESGGTGSNIAVRSDPKPVAFSYGRAINCTNNEDNRVDTTALLQCLREKTTDEITQAQINLNATVYGGDYSIEFMPVVDGNLLKAMPDVLLSNFSSEEYKFFRSLDVIYGTSNTEGIVATIIAYGLQKKYGFNATLEIPNIVLHDEFAPTISRLFYNNNEQVSRAIYDEYSSENTLQQSKNMLNLFTDYIFLAATVRALNSHSHTGSAPSGNTFQYIFSAKGIIEGSFVLPVYFKGAWHGAELSFLFGLNGPGKVMNKTAEGNALRNIMISYWTNFAKHGNPNGQGLSQWPTYDPITAEYLNLNTVLTKGSHVAADRMRFWNWFIPSLLKIKTNTILGKNPNDSTLPK